ncbi:PAS domain S-box protein [Desulfovibrio gilichinskyi]|uniref:histidine kinase n=1 Tax=Desulfovibrio gilichinskyi TaxID=1519643 RepID=A0A1X7EXK0_9BACT|nr:PAS domain S-box protein [Desulfovibrio gilichinskyi]SMF41921.1 PAS domain S-box-containing protein [Desulfovibrio gilichinskyi]
MTDKLRLQAEELIKKDDSATKSSITLEEMQQLLHELRVHQIELELQNEELRRAQEELDAARARYFDLYDLAPVGYCTISEQGLILESNLTAATLLGMLRSEMVGQPWTKFIYKEDQDIYYRQRKDLFKKDVSADTAEFELRLVKKIGGEFWVHLTATTVQNAEKEPVCLLMMHDITERKQEEQFRKDVERIVHHDIKGPLINLFSLAQLVMEGSDEASLMKEFPQIILGIRQVIHLIEAAEPLRKMEKGEYTPAKTPIEIYQILEAVKNSLARLSSQKNVTIVLQTAADCSSADVWLCGEAFLFENIFMNLVKNAVEASSIGGCVTIAIRTELGKVNIAIHNSGTVPELIRDRFFEKYATMGKQAGTGLGTYSAQLITKAHGGQIRFTTSEAEGTTVIVELPLCDIQ